MKNLEAKPFALLGVNVIGHGAKALKEVMDKEKLTWRTFADQRAVGARWSVSGTPTFYVIDHKGVIRYKWVGSPGEKAIDAAIEKLLHEREESGRKDPQ